MVVPAIDFFGIVGEADRANDRAVFRVCPAPLTLRSLISTAASHRPARCRRRHALGSSPRLQRQAPWPAAIRQSPRHRHSHHLCWSWMPLSQVRICLPILMSQLRSRQAGADRGVVRSSRHAGEARGACGPVPDPCPLPAVRSRTRGRPSPRVLKRSKPVGVAFKAAFRAAVRPGPPVSARRAPRPARRLTPCWSANLACSPLAHPDPEAAAVPPVC